MKRLISRKLRSGRAYKFTRGRWKDGANHAVRTTREASRLR